jgi:hypothetical protein
MSNKERFNSKKLNDLEVKEKYQVKISNRFTALENLRDDDDVDNNRYQESIRDNIKDTATETMGCYYYALKLHQT